MADAVIAIVDTGPVIALHGIGQLGLLDQLTNHVPPLTYSPTRNATHPRCTLTRH